MALDITIHSIRIRKTTYIQNGEQGPKAETHGEPERVVVVRSTSGREW